MHSTKMITGLPPRGAARDTLGFSMVELMVVIVILGLMATGVTMSIQTVVPEQRFNTAIRNLAEHLADTRSKAIAYSREFRIYYNLDENWYQVQTPYRLDGGFAVSDDEERRYIHYTDLAKVNIDLLEITIDDRDYFDGEVYVRFDPLGASSNHRIILQHEIAGNLHEYTLEMLPLTGEIRFLEGIVKRPPVEERDFD